MKSIRLFLAMTMVISAIACNAQSGNKETVTAGSDKVEAYYFHFTARCVTCKKVESEAKSAIESLYPGKVTFQSVNLEDASGKALAKKLQVGGQTLMLVKGTKKIILTNEGFMYAVSQPEKLKTIIKEKVDGLL